MLRISQFDKNIADDLLEREAAQIVKDTVLITPECLSS